MQITRFFEKMFHWEKWHYHLKYIPLYPAWLWYCLRSGSFWFFTASNPTLTFGGFEGETKKEMYDQLPPSLIPKSIFISPTENFTDVAKKVDDNHFIYPFVVKPDVGMMGFLFRKISTEQELENYHLKTPVKYIIQELVTDPFEISVFYYRYPWNRHGTITGFLKKEMLDVVGDGKHTLSELMVQLQSRPGFMINEWRNKHIHALDEIIPEGEVFRLSWAANLSRGGKLVHLAEQKDAALLKVFDDLSHYTGHFYYGRYDIKCKTVEQLKNGHFTILEFNGCGAEPHHIYGAGNTLFRAYKIILDHWKVLYRISKHNHQQGIPYWGFWKGLKFLRTGKKHFRLLRKLDATV